MGTDVDGGPPERQTAGRVLKEAEDVLERCVCVAREVRARLGDPEHATPMQETKGQEEAGLLARGHRMAGQAGLLLDALERINAELSDGE